MFLLVLGDFEVQYVGEQHLKHLCDTIKIIMNLHKTVQKHYIAA